MPVTETQFVALAMGVSSLELASANNTETIIWMAGTLGTVKAAVDMHTKRLDGVDTKLERLDSKTDRLQNDLAAVKKAVAGLRADMPGIVVAAMREVIGKG